MEGTKDLSDRKMKVLGSRIGYGNRTDFKGLPSMYDIKYCYFNENFMAGKSWCYNINFQGLAQKQFIQDFVVLEA